MFVLKIERLRHSYLQYSTLILLTIKFNICAIIVKTEIQESFVESKYIFIGFYGAKLKTGNCQGYFPFTFFLQKSKSLDNGNGKNRSNWFYHTS